MQPSPQPSMKPSMQPSISMIPSTQPSMQPSLSMRPSTLREKAINTSKESAKMKQKAQELQTYLNSLKSQVEPGNVATTLHPTPLGTGPTTAPTASSMPSTLMHFVHISQAQLNHQKDDLKRMQDEVELYVDHLNNINKQPGAARKLSKLSGTPATSASKDSKIPLTLDASMTTTTYYNPSTL